MIKTTKIFLLLFLLLSNALAEDIRAIELFKEVRCLVCQGQTIHAMDDFTILESTNGGDMSIHSINFRGPGGFNIENRADLDGVGGKGILLNVRDNQYGMVKLVLNDVKVSDVANHGIHVSDCDVGAKCGAGGGGAGGGSPASISVSLNNVSLPLE